MLPKLELETEAAPLLRDPSNSNPHLKLLLLDRKEILQLWLLNLPTVDPCRRSCRKMLRFLTPLLQDSPVARPE
jgi:hypothetical protein